PSVTFSNGILLGTTEPGSSLQVFEEDSRVAVVLADQKGAWNFPLTFQADGTYHFKVTATDAAGNTSPAAGPLAITIDVTLPASVIAFPEDSSQDSAGSWPGRITGTASDSSSGVQKVMVSIQQGSTGLYWNG